MKYINASEKLKKEFQRLMNTYANYYWMVAWAGHPFELTDELNHNNDKIRRLVVGLHFYQTHPEFIERFNEHECVRFIHNTSGTFHPKVFLFLNDENNWELLIGSANFTGFAFNKNNEACLLIKGDESNKHIYNQVLTSINEAWKQSKKFDEEELKDYKRYWIPQRTKINSLARYTETKNKKIPFSQILIVKTTWEEFIERIYSANRDSVDERIKVLDLAQDYFHTYSTFAEMPELERARIGGYKWGGQPADFRLFGTMLYGRAFTHQINTDPTNISDALDAIPLYGDISKDDYLLFVNRFEAALNGGNKYRSGTRLLAMKRPDFFFCISNGNHEKLAYDFGLKGISTMNFDKYWDEIIHKIHESNWWRKPNPQNKIEKKIAKYRAAFMDAMYYAPLKKAK